MTKIIDFEKKRREKLSSFDHFSKSQKYLRGDRIRRDYRTSKESPPSKTEMIKASKEEMLIEIYIVETIEKLRNLYVTIAIVAAISCVFVTSWTVNNAVETSDVIPGFVIAVGLAHLTYVTIVRAMGEHYFKRRFKRTFNNLLDHLEEQDSQEEEFYEDIPKEL